MVRVASHPIALAMGRRTKLADILSTVLLRCGLSRMLCFFFLSCLRYLVFSPLCELCPCLRDYFSAPRLLQRFVKRDVRHGDRE
jgi:hypothetical protein